MHQLQVKHIHRQAGPADRGRNISEVIILILMESISAAMSKKIRNMNLMRIRNKKQSYSLPHVSLADSIIHFFHGLCE